MLVLAVDRVETSVMVLELVVTVVHGLQVSTVDLAKA